MSIIYDAYGTEQQALIPLAKVESAIAQCKEEADKMFFDVLGRKDKADKTRNGFISVFYI